MISNSGYWQKFVKVMVPFNSFECKPTIVLVRVLEQVECLLIDTVIGLVNKFTVPAVESALNVEVFRLFWRIMRIMEVEAVLLDRVQNVVYLVDYQTV